MPDIFIYPLRKLTSFNLLLLLLSVSSLKINRFYKGKRVLYCVTGVFDPPNLEIYHSVAVTFNGTKVLSHTVDTHQTIRCCIIVCYQATIRS